MTPVLEARGVSRTFRIRSGLFRRETAALHAVAEVDLTIAAGECVGLVGESGSGKSTLARCLVFLDRPTTGRVLHRGEELAALPPVELRRRRLGLPMVFQEAAGSLDPRRTAGASIAEALAARGVARAERPARARALLEAVGLAPALAPRYRHQLSGGQCQRVALARALACEPELIAADEPTSALDAASRLQILELFARLKRERDLALLFVSHDLSAVEQVADRIAVLYAGRIVELAPAGELIRSPRHPYTAALLAAVPRPRERPRRPRRAAHTEAPDPLALPSGCAFHPRCPIARDRCTTERPALVADPQTGREVACWFPGEAQAGSLD